MRIEPHFLQYFLLLEDDAPQIEHNVLFFRVSKLFFISAIRSLISGMGIANPSPVASMIFNVFIPSVIGLP